MWVGLHLTFITGTGLKKVLVFPLICQLWEVDVLRVKIVELEKYYCHDFSACHKCIIIKIVHTCAVNNKATLTLILIVTAHKNSNIILDELPHNYHNPGHTHLINYMQSISTVLFFMENTEK